MVDFLVGSQVARFAALVAIFAIVVVVALIVGGLVNRQVRSRQSLARLDQLSQATVASNVERRTLRQRSNAGAWQTIITTIEKLGLDLTDTKSERLREKMREAGYDNPSAPKIYTLVRLILVFLLPLGYIALAYSNPEPPSFIQVYIWGSLLALLGLYLPSIYIRAKADRRRTEIINGFPDCLDLLLVCVEAGLGIEAAMDRVGREMATSHPLVSQLMAIATMRMRAGASREEAFRSMADNARVDEIRSFTTLLIQSDRLGTSIATTLRVYAEEMREKRRMRAEEKAHRIPVLIAIPLVTCMLPTMIGVLMLPAAIRVVNEIFPIMSRGG